MASYEIGSFNRTRVDTCDYAKRVYESTSPLAYMLFFGAHENCGKCVKNKFYTKYDLVDVESDLLNIIRPLSKCEAFNYNPNCNSKNCMSTFSRHAPIVPDPSICPIVHTNMHPYKNPGYHVQHVRAICKK